MHKSLDTCHFRIRIEDLTPLLARPDPSTGQHVDSAFDRDSATSVIVQLMCCVKIKGDTATEVLARSGYTIDCEVGSCFGGSAVASTTIVKHCWLQRIIVGSCRDECHVLQK